MPITVSYYMPYQNRFTLFISYLPSNSVLQRRYDTYVAHPPTRCELQLSALLALSVTRRFSTDRKWGLDVCRVYRVFVSVNYIIHI